MGGVRPGKFSQLGLHLSFFLDGVRSGQLDNSFLTLNPVEGDWMG
jgi:hypothetical protein